MKRHKPVRHGNSEQARIKAIIKAQNSLTIDNVNYRSIRTSRLSDFILSMAKKSRVLSHAFELTFLLAFPTAERVDRNIRGLGNV